MKLTKLAVGTILLSSSIFVSTTPAFAALEDGQAAKVESNGSITLREKPVDPENPDNSGPLRIKVLQILNLESSLFLVMTKFIAQNIKRILMKKAMLYQIA